MQAATANNSIEISPPACDALRQLDLDGGRFLRITVVKGGCSGMTYEVDIDTVQLPFDQTLYDQDGLTVVADPQSAPLLRGLKIDYSSDLVSVGFRFSNPNASAACGCGSSFAA